MPENNLFQIRVTGIFIENDRILLVKQQYHNRNWSLPGGRLENRETLEEGIVREIKEETGLYTRINKLLYICDKVESSPPLLHISFLLDKVSGELMNPTNEFDNNTIEEVKMVPIVDLVHYGFSERFQNIIANGFVDCGGYMGLKENIGL